MPQMAPINWLSLFLLFIMIFMMFNIMNYYNFMPPSPKTMSSKFNINSMNWKW
uniref:ATP synthase complex subunit 8 n=1 Tax=Formicosepsis sp. LX2018-01 TaxID=2697604 RepID=A0A6G6A6B4_9MUSC|nr:ATP synthase F0 subunit 8 [Formicosepsis sp. LX2018-01]